MFEHREIDDYEKYINERQQGRAGTNGSGLRDDRNRDSGNYDIVCFGICRICFCIQ